MSLSEKNIAGGDNRVLSCIDSLGLIVYTDVQQEKIILHLTEPYAN